MELIEPTMDYAAEIEAYRREFLLAGSSMDGSGRLRRFENAADWIDDVSLFKSPETVPEGWMPATQYICVREADRKIVGMLDIRHRFNDYLEKYAGHIGYSVRPGERRKGYAEWMLSRALNECRRLGIEKVLICCVKGNEGSRRTILKNGGVYESTVLEPDKGKEIERYWIDLKDYVFDPRKHIAEIMFRPVSPRDAESACKWMNDPEMVKYLGYGFVKPRKLEDIREEFRLIEEGEFTGHCFSVMNEEQTEYLGQANLILPDERAKTAEISLVLMPDMKGQRVGTKALKTLMRLGFDFYGFQRLHARCLSANIPAIRLFEKAGFTREGVLRRHMMTRDGLMDILLFGMLKEEFRQRYD